MSMSYGDFPEWTDVGSKVIDEDGNVWVIVDRYITGEYNIDWGMLVLEHESIPGVEAEVQLGEVKPLK